MKTFTTKAIVLRRVDYGEADRIITVMSAELGKVSALARGVRKLKSKLAGGIEPLAVNKMTLIEGKNGLYTLRSARMDQQLPDILKTLERNELAFAALKQINDLVEEGQGSEFYDLLEAYLLALNDGLDLGLAELWWSLRLLSMLGHEPNLATDADGKELRAEQTYMFNPEEGTFSPTELQRDDVFTADHIKLWRLALQLEPMKLAHIKNAKRLASNNQSLKLLVANNT